MKRTNRIISLILSAQVAVTSVFAGPVFSQKQPNPIGGVTAPLDSKDKKNIDAKTIAKKTVLFPLKALWWVTKPQLIMLGTAIFDLSLLAGYDGYETYKLCKTNPLLADFIAHYNFSDGTLIKTPLSIKQTAKLCADMRYCLAKMTEKEGSETSGTSSEYKNIADKYSSLTDKFEIMEEFLSHFELINKYLIEITDDLQGLISKYLIDIIEKTLAGLSDIPVYAYNKKYCILAFDKSFEIGDRTIDQIIKQFYRQCSRLIAPDKNPENQERATEVQQKLNAWKDTMDKILAKNLKKFSACDIIKIHD